MVNDNEPSMFCTACYYPLNGLDRTRCPACGQDFDPNNSSTYLNKSSSPLAQKLTLYAHTITKIIGILSIGVIIWLPCIFWDIEIIITGIEFYIFFVILSLFITSPFIILGRKRAQWEIYETWGIVLPYIAWFIFIPHNFSINNLEQFIFQMIILSAIMPIAAITRIIVGSRNNKTYWALGLIIILCTMAILIGAMTPDIPGGIF